MPIGQVKRLHSLYIFCFYLNEFLWNIQVRLKYYDGNILF